MKRLFNSKIIIFFLIFLYGSAVTLFMYYPTFNLDGYCQLALSYKSYAYNFFIAGRFITAYIWEFFDLINISHNLLSIISHLLSITFLSLSVNQIFFCLKKYVNDNFMTKLLLLLGCILTIFNPFTQSIFIYEETFCMALSVFLSVMAAITINKGTNVKRFIISLIMLVCANFLYQGTISYFIPFVILINIFKNKNDSLTKYVKNNYKDIFIFALIYGLSCIIGFITLQLYVNLTNVTSMKVGKVNILENISLIINMIYKSINGMHSMIWASAFKECYILLLVIIILRMFVDFKNKYKYVIYVIVMSLLTLLSSFIPNIVMSSSYNYTAPRMLLTFGALIGVITICSLLFFDKKEVKLNTYFYSLILLVSSVFFIASSITIFYNSYKAYQRYGFDLEYVTDIKNIIDEYEEDNNIKIKEIYYSISSVKKPNYDGWFYNVNNVRVSSSGWGFACGVKGLINKQYIVKAMDDDTYQKMIENDTSIIFEKEKLYILLN